MNDEPPVDPKNWLHHALVALDQPVTDETLDAALAALVGKIEQQTPNRVAHRRADRVRCRNVQAITGQLLDPRCAEIHLHCDGGLYVKELISGDEGRTQPNLAQCLGVAARVSELDVTAIEGDFL